MKYTGLHGKMYLIAIIDFGHFYLKIVRQQRVRYKKTDLALGYPQKLALVLVPYLSVKCYHLQRFPHRSGGSRDDPFQKLFRNNYFDKSYTRIHNYIYIHFFNLQCSKIPTSQYSACVWCHRSEGTI